MSAISLGTTRTCDQAVQELLQEYSWNPWFMNSYWPENEPRVRFLVQMALEGLPAVDARRTLEVGCANGYIAVSIQFARI